MQFTIEKIINNPNAHPYENELADILAEEIRKEIDDMIIEKIKSEIKEQGFEEVVGAKPKMELR